MRTTSCTGLVLCAFLTPGVYRGLNGIGMPYLHYTFAFALPAHRVLHVCLRIWFCPFTPVVARISSFRRVSLLVAHNSCARGLYLSLLSSFRLLCVNRGDIRVFVLVLWRFFNISLSCISISGAPSTLPSSAGNFETGQDAVGRTKRCACPARMFCFTGRHLHELAPPPLSQADRQMEHYCLISSSALLLPSPPPSILPLLLDSDRQALKGMAVTCLPYPHIAFLLPSFSQAWLPVTAPLYQI